MAEYSSDSICNLWKKLQAKFSSGVSSSQTLVLPKLNKINDMVYEVHKPQFEEKPEVEIVLCHGLQLSRCEGAYITTWMSHDDSEFWPQTWLADAFPKSRILTISYDSTTQKTNEDGPIDIFCTAENLLYSLTSVDVRLGEFGCPVVLVGHCLGGLLLKELCIHANKRLSEKGAERMDRIRDFFSNLRGMFFFATPHIGSLLGDKLHNCFKEDPLLAEITTLNASSARKNESFCHLKSNRKWLTYGMGETKETFVDCLGNSVHVVPEASSRHNMDIYYSVDANHFNICKPESKQTSTFTCLRGFIHQIREEDVLRSSNPVDTIIGQDYVVDMYGRAEEVKRMLAQPDANTIFIVGLRGIGKTTLAKQVFRDISSNFLVKCFVHLDSIEAGSNDSEQVLRKIQDELKRQGKGWCHDYFSVPQYLKCKKVLLVLDNVQSQSQLDTLDRALWLEGSTSRLIVITTQSRLGFQPNTFKVEYLDPRESEKLFVHFAFQGRHKPKSLEYSIKQVMKKCENFPLSLKILGSYLSKENVHDIELWKDLLDRLENAEEVASDHDYKLWARLRPCYNALTPSEQEIFLDVATVFCGFPLDYVQCIWRACRVSPLLAWNNLERAFLVTGKEDHPVHMHGLLKDLGRSIACPPSSTIDRWRRVSGCSSTREFIARSQEVMETLSLELQVQTNEMLTMRNTTFVQYVKLEYLILDGIETTQGNVELPRSLVYLRWKDGLFEACPVDFNQLVNLVVLDLRFCKAMEIVPSSVGKKLKWLELEGCRSLKDLPLELLKFSDLEYLGLSMTGLTKLPTNLGKLKKLRCLQANHTQLVRVTQAIGRLRMLQCLNISNTTVKVLPESIGDLKLLTGLNASNTLLSSLPDSIGQLERLLDLRINCTKVRVLPESFGNLKLLRYLNAQNTLLSSLPESIGCLKDLCSLYLSHTRIRGLPQSMGDMVGLQTLLLASTPLEIFPDSICKLQSLLDLELSDTQISELPDAFGELGNLGHLQLRGLRLRSLPRTMENLSLGSFEITISTILNDSGHSGSGPHSTILGCHRDSGCSVDLRFKFMLDGAPENTGVREEREIVGAIVSLSSLISSPRFAYIESVSMDGEHYREPVLSTLFHPLPQMPRLENLSLINFSEVETIPSEIGILTELRELTVESCFTLRELPETLGNLLRLNDLSLVGLSSLSRLPESTHTIWARPGLNLIIKDCGRLQSMPNSCGHTPPSKRNLSTSCDVCLTSYSSPLLYPVLNGCVETDSWGLLRCFLECCHLGDCTICFRVRCEEMERLSNLAAEDTEAEESIVATKIFREDFSECHVGDDDPHEIFAPSTCWPSLNDLSQIKLTVSCGFRCRHSYPSTSRVMDIEEAGDEDTEEEIEQDKSEVDDEDAEEDVDEEDTQSEQDDDEEIEGRQDKFDSMAEHRIAKRQKSLYFWGQA